MNKVVIGAETVQVWFQLEKMGQWGISLKRISSSWLAGWLGVFQLFSQLCSIVDFCHDILLTTSRNNRNSQQWDVIRQIKSLLLLSQVFLIMFFYWTFFPLRNVDQYDNSLWNTYTMILIPFISVCTMTTTRPDPYRHWNLMLLLQE